MPRRLLGLFGRDDSPEEIHDAIRAQLDAPRAERIGLVSCVKTKLDEPAPARELYTSPLFRGARAAVEESCDRWFVLSAKHGLVEPDAVLEPYEQTLTDAPVDERRAWSDRVLEQLREHLGDPSGRVVEIHAGRSYYAWGLADGLEAAGMHVELPVEGLTLGQRLAHYAGVAPQVRRERERRPTPPPRPAGAAVRGQDSPPPGPRYQPLHEHLLGAGPVWSATFSEVEQVLGRSLPPSARRHRPWWGNNASSVQARAWLHAGYRVQQLDMDAETLVFRQVG